MSQLGSFYIILASLLWSLDGLLRRSLYALPPATLVMLEHAFGVLIALPLLPKVIHEYKKLTKTDWLVVFILTLTASVMATLFYTSALTKIDYIQFSVVVLLQQTQPIFSVALAALLLKEKITPRYLIFAVIGLVAAYFLAFPTLTPNFTHQPQELTAAALAMGAAVFWAASNSLGKLVLNRISHIAAALLRFTLAIPLAFLASRLLHQTMPLSQINSKQWLSLLGIALSSGMVAFIIFYKGLRLTEAKIATFVKLAWPIFAALTGWIFLKERLTPIQLIAAAVLLTDILILSLSQPHLDEKTLKTG
jgi:drug/metabolite transporter (DMT)-like permease